MSDLSELFKLSVAERIHLAQDLWDSVAAEPERMPPLSQAQKNEIDRRLADHAADPFSAESWEAVRARLWSRIKGAKRKRF